MAHETALCCRLTRQAGKAIETLDRKYGLDIPIEVIGYSCIERSTSVRSDKRVINYIIAGYQKGRTCGDLKHMLMRGAGSTRAVSQQCFLLLCCWRQICVGYCWFGTVWHKAFNDLR